MGLLIDEDFAVENLLRILERAQRNSDPFVRIDMEGSAVTQATLRVFERAFARRPNVGIVLQAYLKRTAADVERAIDLGARVRLCKGAYSEPPDIAYESMPEIRERFMLSARELLTRGRYPGIATHDPAMIDLACQYAREHHIAPDRFEFQMLYSIRRDLQARLLKEGYRLRVYIPFGRDWFPYFMRRLGERPDNVIFVVRAILGETG